MKRSKFEHLVFVFIAGVGLYGCPSLFDADVQKDLKETFDPPDELGIGETCWTGEAPTSSDGSYTLSEFNKNNPSVQEENAFCADGSYCHPKTGCTPLPKAGESCEEVPIDATFNFCLDPDDVCYPSEPTGSDLSQPGPRICRKFPTAENEWCDPTIRAECDPWSCLDSGESDTPYCSGNLYYWKSFYERDPLMYFELGKWTDWPTEHLNDPNAEEETFGGNYPVFRRHKLICQNNQCVPAPAPGEPCALIAESKITPAIGHLKTICAQPDNTEDTKNLAFCLNGICTTMGDLPADTCFAPDAYDPDLDPVWCNTPSEWCGVIDKYGVEPGSPTCLSHCTPEGTCGMCPICYLEDRSLVEVSGPEDCVEEEGAWVQEITAKETGYNPDSCGWSHEAQFNNLAPVTGQLWVDVGIFGNLATADQYFDLYINGEFITKLDTGQECPGNIMDHEDDPNGEFQLEESWIVNGSIHMELRGSPSVCRTCSANPNPNARFQLQNRTKTYLGLTRHDGVCGN